jgi:hypothetical protein
MVEEASFNTIKTSGSYSDTGLGNDEVQFFYKVAAQG